MSDELQDTIFGLIPEDGCDETTMREIFEGIFSTPSTVANQRIPSVRDLARRSKLGESAIYGIVNAYKRDGKLNVRHGVGIFVSPRFNAFGLSRNPFDYPGTPALPQAVAPRDPQLFWQCGNDLADPTWLNRRTFMELVKKNRDANVFATNARWISQVRGNALSELLMADLQANRGFLFEPANFSLRYGRLATQLQLMRLLLKPGDTVVTTVVDDGVLGSVLADRGIRVLPADPADETGFLSMLEGLARAASLRLVHVHPRAGLLGKRISAATMQRLVDLAAEHDLWLLEEDRAHEFHFAAEEFRPLAAHDHRGRVIHLRPISLLDPDLAHRWQVIAATGVIQGLNRLPDLAMDYADTAKEQSLEELLRSNKWVLAVQHAREQALKNRNELHGLFEIFMEGHATAIPPDAGLNMAVVPSERRHVPVFAEYLPAHPNPVNGQGVDDGAGPSAPWLRIGFGRIDQKELLGQVKGLAEALSLST